MAGASRAGVVGNALDQGGGPIGGRAQAASSSSWSAVTMRVVQSRTATILLAAIRGVNQRRREGGARAARGRREGGAKACSIPAVHRDSCEHADETSIAHTIRLM